MTISEAKRMISSSGLKSGAQTWLDLGCGAGTFTLALAEILPNGSKVIGVDRSFQNLPKTSSNGVAISFLQEDFSKGLSVEAVDGVMMANSLHYIADPTPLIEHLISLMPEYPQFLLIEYERTVANPWVPYPLSYAKLSKLFMDQSLSITKIGERASIFGSTKMYAAQVNHPTNQLTN